MFTFCSLNVNKVPCFKFSRVIERYPRNKNVRQTWLYTVIKNNNNRRKKYIHGISTSDKFSVTASSPSASLVGSWTPPLTDSWTFSTDSWISFSANSWISSSFELSAEFSFELESSVVFSLKLATTTCKIRVMFLLKTAFSSSHSRGSKWRRLTNFPVNSASMIAMLVKLLLVLIASKTSPATSEFFEKQVCPLLSTLLP